MGILETVTGIATLAGSLKGSSNKTSGSQDTISNTTGNSREVSKTAQKTTGITKGSTETNAITSEQSKAATNTKSKTVNDNTQTSRGSTTGNETTTGVQSGLGFDSRVMAGLNDLLMGATANAGINAAQSTLAERMAQLQQQGANSTFDPVAFADSITAGAKSEIGGRLEGSLNDLMTQSGGTEGGNSMAALLGARLRNDATAELSAASATARATGEEILSRQNQALTGQMTDVSQGMFSGITGLINSLSGAQTTQQNQQQSANTTSNLQRTDTKDVTKATGNTQNTTNVNSSTNTTGTSLDKTSQQIRNQTGVNTTSSQNQVSQSQASQKGGSGLSLFDNLGKMLSETTAKA